MIEAPLALAFGAGMVATVNPCGFPLLPAYLSYFLGNDGPIGSTRASVGRSLAVGASVSAGFLAVFVAAGLALSHLGLSVYRWAPWFTIVIGIALLALGVAMLRGFQLVLALPKLNRGGRSRTGQSMFLFGVSYAVASLSCTLPTFMAATAGTFRRENLASGIATFAAYALGMSLVLLALTVSMGLARQSFLHTMRRALPHVSRVAGGLLVVAGAYVTWFGVHDLRVRGGDLSGNRVVDVVTGWSNALTNWVYDIGPVRLGALLTIGLGTVLTLTYGIRVRRRARVRG